MQLRCSCVGGCHFFPSSVVNHASITQPSNGRGGLFSYFRCKAPKSMGPKCPETHCVGEHYGPRLRLTHHNPNRAPCHALCPLPRRCPGDRRRQLVCAPPRCACMTAPDSPRVCVPRPLLSPASAPTRAAAMAGKVPLACLPPLPRASLIPSACFLCSCGQYDKCTCFYRWTASDCSQVRPDVAGRRFAAALLFFAASFPPAPVQGGPRVVQR